MSRKRNSEENARPSTKEEIEAAVNACYGNPKERITVDIPAIPRGEEPEPIECDECEPQRLDCDCDGCTPDPVDPRLLEDHPVDICGEDGAGFVPGSEASDGKPTLKQFLSDCTNLKITAGDCHYWSERSSDLSIEEFLKGINKKIYKETQVGGYSTNVTIRVVQKDWVNVSHIMDWYKSKGFEVLNYRINNSPINMDTGVIEHNFTISWA